jgi:glycine cleavage system transcriptional repressor
MPQLAVSALGRDQPGIVAAITAVLVAHRLNIADSQMGVLSGRFSLMLIVDTPPDGFETAALQDDLQRAGDELGMDTVGVYTVGDEPESDPQPTHIVTVYGVDHPGIVHAVAHELAARGISITDLNTRRVAEEDEEPLYAMMLEVHAPDGVEGALDRVAVTQGVEVTVRELDDDAL